MTPSPQTPSRKFSNRLAFQMAWRESRASSAKFLFVILAVAIGVGTLTGVKGFSRAFHNMLLREARTLMAADLMVRSFSLPSAPQTQALDRLQAQGVKHTWVTETISMLGRASTDAKPVLVSVKAVEPGLYPFYGEVQLDPPGRLAQVLTADHIAVSPDVLLRTGDKIGEHVRIGGQDFIIGAVVLSEPDRMSGSLNVGPRVLMSRDALARARLMIAGSRASERFLFRVPASVPIESVNQDLKSAFPEALITDFRQSHPTVEQGLKRATVFLSLVSLIALIVGALGVAMAIDSHLQQKLDSIAIMKCIGARSSQVTRIYTIQTLGLGLSGGLLGILGGFALQAVFPFLIGRYLQVRPGFSVDLVSAVQGLAIGVLATLLFTLPPLLSIRRIRPGLILRRDVAVDRRTWSARLRDGLPSLVSIVIILLGIGGIAAWLADSVRTGLYFVGGLACSLLAMAAVAWLLLRGLRWFGKHVAWRLRPSLRHGIANLYRPGAHTQSALIALGIGVMFTLTVFLVQRGMIADMMKDAPPGMSNVFLLDMTPANRAAVIDLVSHQKGVQNQPDSVGTVRVRMAAVNGRTLIREDLKGAERRYAAPLAVTEFAAIPGSTKITSGKWWDPRNPPAEPQFSLADDAAKLLHWSPGTRVLWTTPERNFTAVMVATHRTEQIRLTARVDFIFSPGSLAGLPVIYYGSVRVTPSAVGPLQNALYRQFPTVTVINVADVLAIVQGVVDQIATVVRFISAFAILAGVIILASSVAGTRLRRIREVVILKTLGATRRRLIEIFSIEFLILGAVAGLAGGLLATAFSSLLLGRLFEADVRLDLLPNVAAIFLTALVANAAGWLASLRILNQRPLVVLREE